MLDDKGNIVVGFKYSNPIQELGENFVISEGDNTSGVEYILDKNRKVHTKMRFDRIIPHSDYAIVIKNEKYGIIDNNFKTKISFKYDCLYSDYNGKYLIAKKAKNMALFMCVKI